MLKHARASMDLQPAPPPPPRREIVLRHPRLATRLFFSQIFLPRLFLHVGVPLVDIIRRQHHVGLVDPRVVIRRLPRVDVLLFPGNVSVVSPPRVDSFDSLVDFKGSQLTFLTR